MRALTDVHVLEWQRALICAAAGAALLISAVVRAKPSISERRTALLVLALLTAPYGYGAGIIADAHWDRSAPAVYQARVERKHIAHGRSPRAYLLLGPWGTRTASDDVAVSWSLYNSTSVGDEICVAMRRGLLSIAWYETDHCNAPATEVTAEPR
jgi:hypothetical protein